MRHFQVYWTLVHVAFLNPQLFKFEFSSCVVGRDKAYSPQLLKPTSICCLIATRHYLKLSIMRHTCHIIVQLASLRDARLASAFGLLLAIHDPRLGPDGPECLEKLKINPATFVSTNCPEIKPWGCPCSRPTPGCRWPWAWPRWSWMSGNVLNQSSCICWTTFVSTTLPRNQSLGAS